MNWKRAILSSMAALVFLAAGLSSIPAAAGTFGYSGPGRVEGTGTVFEVAGGDGPQVTLTLGSEALVLLESTENGVQAFVEPQVAAAEAVLTLEGLTPGATYHKYVDDLYRHDTLTADETGKISFILPFDGPHRVFIKNRPSTLYLAASPWTDSSNRVHNAGWSDSFGADRNGDVGNFDAATATGTLSRDVAEIIQVVTGNTTLDGAGFRVYGTAPWSAGVYLSRVSGVTMRNLHFSNAEVDISYSSGCRIEDNTFTYTVQSRAIHLFASGGNAIVRNAITDAWTGIFISIYSWGNIIEDNAISGAGGYAVEFIGYTGGHSIRRNKISNCGGGLYFFNSSSHTIEGNVISACQVGALLDYNLGNLHGISYNLHIYNNNFVDNVVPAVAHALSGPFNIPLPEGGNFWSGHTGPDADGDGIVDVAFQIFDKEGNPGPVDALPWTRADGWIANLPPVFSPVAPISVSEYEPLQLQLVATDPEGAAVTLTVSGLPTGASFDPATGTFLWRPLGDQAGVYTINFQAADAGTPPAVGQLDVVVTVGDVTSPTQLSEMILEDIAQADLPVEVTNSYVANLKKVGEFVAEGKVRPAREQLDSFIQKVEMDIQFGKIAPELGALYLSMAQDLLEMLSPV
jgi:parallel beta-helix repeat protein